MEMKASLGGLSDDNSNTILYTNPRRWFKRMFFCWSWQEVDAWWILALLYWSTGKNWSSIACPQLHHKGQLLASRSSAVSNAPTICAGCLMLLLTHRQFRLLQMSRWKWLVTLAVLSYKCSCKPSPALSSRLTDCRKCTELQLREASLQILLCCPLTSSSAVFAVPGQTLLWSVAHTEPSIPSMLWSPFTVFKVAYSQFNWTKIGSQALMGDLLRDILHRWRMHSV